MSVQLSHVVAELRAGRDVHLTAEDAEALWREVFEVEMACRPDLDVGHRWEDDGMTHDPLCPWEPETLWTGESRDDIHYRRPEIPCQCDLIARVRADESRAAANRLLQGALVEGTPIFGCPVCPDIWESEPSCEHHQVAERFADMLGKP